MCSRTDFNFAQLVMLLWIVNKFQNVCNTDMYILIFICFWNLTHSYLFTITRCKVQSWVHERACRPRRNPTVHGGANLVQRSHRKSSRLPSYILTLPIRRILLSRQITQECLVLSRVVNHTVVDHAVVVANMRCWENSICVTRKSQVILY